MNFLLLQESKLNLMPFSITVSVLCLSRTTVFSCLIFNMHQTVLITWQIYSKAQIQVQFIVVLSITEHLSLSKLIVFHYSNLLPLIPTTE